MIVNDPWYLRSVGGIGMYRMDIWPLTLKYLMSTWLAIRWFRSKNIPPFEDYNGNITQMIQTPFTVKKTLGSSKWSSLCSFQPTRMAKTWMWKPPHVAEVLIKGGTGENEAPEAKQLANLFWRKWVFIWEKCDARCPPNNISRLGTYNLPLVITLFKK